MLKFWSICWNSFIFKWFRESIKLSKELSTEIVDKILASCSLKI